MLSKILHKLLAWFARMAIGKYKPIIIGVTGSVGKSSTKEAIYAVLKNYFQVRRNLANYNNEIGLPLTILGRQSPEKSLTGWLRVFWMAIGTVWFPERSYPKILILEMAADHPGDIKYLINIAPPQIGILTAIGPTHLEFFKTVENVAREKARVISFLPPTGWAILNADDEEVMALKNRTEAKILTYGFSEKADIRALEPELEQEIENNSLKINGLRFKISYSGSIVPVFLANVLTKAQIYSALAAVAVGIAFDLNLIEIAESLVNCKTLSSRMKPIAGVKNSLIIDDSYNSSPLAAEMALETLSELKKSPSSKKWAVLGDMLELGEMSEEAHLDLGKKVARAGIDCLVAVGKWAELVAKSAVKNGLDKENIEVYPDSITAAKALAEKIGEGDIVLIKGSHAVHLEKIVKCLIKSKPSL